jgi:putative FmdB family regulatory protein
MEVIRMPIYSFQCPKCGFVREDLRKMGDYEAPECVYCKKQVMERFYEPVTTVLKGQGWSHGQQEKLRVRSKEQGKKFFRRHPNLQEEGARKIDSIPK